jgi:hypothetical protein
MMAVWPDAVPPLLSRAVRRGATSYSFGLPTDGDRLDELLYVGLTRATTELVVIAPAALARRLG